MGPSLPHPHTDLFSGTFRPLLNEVCYNAHLARITAASNQSHLPVFRIAGRVAQSVEQRIENPRVGSSILPPATSIYSHEY